jgi:DNA-binding NtrC family response regulator
MLYETTPARDAGKRDADPKEPAAPLTRDEIEWALARHDGNVSAAAKEAKVSRPAFYRAMERTGVTPKKGRAR